MCIEPTANYKQELYAMAFSAPSFTDISLTLIDRDNNKSTMSLQTEALLDITDLDAAVVADLIPAIQALSDAVVIAYTVSRTSRDLSYTQPGEVSDVERKGVFTFRDAGGFSSIVAVPSIKNTLIVDGTNVIDRTNAAVVDFAGIMLGGSLLGASQPTSVHGNDLVAITKAVKTHRKSSKG